MVGALSKNFGHYGWPMTKNFKKHWLKRTKEAPQKIGLWTKIHFFGHTTFLYSSARSSGHD